MSALGTVAEVLSQSIEVLRPVIFVTVVVTAVFAGASWIVRTRRLSPFGSTARFIRQRIDPLFLPAENRIRQLGVPATQASFWTIGAVAVGGLILLALLQFVQQQLMLLMATTYSGFPGIAKLIANWALMLLKAALIGRVIASWLGKHADSRGWRWSFVLTEWCLRPLRRILPRFGVIDLSPLLAYFAISVGQSLISTV